MRDTERERQRVCGGGGGSVYIENRIKYTN